MEELARDNDIFGGYGMSASDYIYENWILILVLLGFAVSLISTVFMQKKTISRLFALIIQVFILSVVVYIEFKIADANGDRMLRLILMAIRYSSTPFLVAQIIYAVAKNQKWYVFIPAALFAVLDFVSIPTGIVFALDAEGELVRGPLGMLPYFGAGMYCAYLIYFLIRHRSKQMTEIVPIFFFGFAFASGLLLPFTLGREYAHIFCATIAVSMFVYYVFMILQLTKRDSLTGLLNRQAYYSDIENEPETITALISVDMNGLKTINDNFGHEIGDQAIAKAAAALRTVFGTENVYRIGGDEFVVFMVHSTQVQHDLIARKIDQINRELQSPEDGLPAVSLSVGIVHGSQVTDIDSLFESSDAAMYESKKHGKHTYTFYS
jgi:diguanylate cyclase (GGDEF)-like protein